MKISGLGKGKLAAAGALALGAALIGATAWASAPNELLGQPTPGGLGLQAAASPLKEQAHFFHDVVLLPIITAISLFVAGLLLWVMFRFNKRANPVPAKWSHNTAIEVVWTLVPVGILMFIALFSFQLLFAYHDEPEIDMTIKVTGYQWYWGYEYPDHGIDEFSSVMLPEAEARAGGHPYLLAVDNPVVVPVNTNVRLLITAQDVIHAVAMPAFGLKTDAIPGRVNSTWFRATKEGRFYGQCSELCGVDHAFMPIQINVVSQAEFEAWIAQQGGTLPGAADAQAQVAAPAPTADPAAPAPAAPQQPTAGAAPVAAAQ